LVGELIAHADVGLTNLRLQRDARNIRVDGFARSTRESSTDLHGDNRNDCQVDMS
jgi:hypothetical protein